MRGLLTVATLAVLVAGGGTTAVAANSAGAHGIRVSTVWTHGLRLPSASRRPGGLRRGPISMLGTADRLGPGTAVLDGSPGFQLATNSRTGTLYVPVQCRNASTNASCAKTPSKIVDVISTRRCKPHSRWGCRVVARATAGAGAFLAVVDERTDTVYVANDVANTVSVINGAACNAQATSGCGRPLATIKVGKLPSAAALNPRTDTLYTANPAGGSISVINIAQCSAVTTRGCTQPVKTIKDRRDPDGIDVDLATDTVYAANDGSTGNGNTVSVYNGATCNGHNSSGCGHRPHLITVGSGPFWDVVDQPANTVYTANNNDGTVSVINGATCNAAVTTGCGQAPRAVTTGASATFVGIDYRLHTLFTMNQDDGTLSEINTATCNGTDSSGCPARAGNFQPSYNPPSGYNAANFALSQKSGIVYLANAGGANFLSAASINRCNATTTAGCRVEAPAVPDSVFTVSIDPATDTIYAGNLSLPQIDVINGATCNVSDLSGCTPVAEIPMPDPTANVGAIDDATHTLYAADESPSGTVAVIDTATCNAGHTSGCAASPPMISIGAFPNPPVFNPATRTLYTSYGDKADRVAVINAATCNATDTAGCGQTPAVVKVGNGTDSLAVSEPTDTIYGANAGLGFTGHTVSVINGATCDGTHHSGCGHLAATIRVGIGPVGVAVDASTHTAYVANNANGDLPGTVSMINIARCNAANTAGCRRRFPVAPTGRSPIAVSIDTGTGNVYISDFSSAALTVLHGQRCNATTTSGCRRSRELATSSQPFGLAIDPLTGTVYATLLFQAGGLAIVKAVG
jgi:DNA-binding beta-propeller fold protein YncE